jgi:hypothetical protein
MQFADLSPSIQLLSYGLLAVVLASFLTRAVVFFRQKNEGTQPLYPIVWSVAQCRALEYFRLLIGVALVPLWVSLLFLVPSIPTNWPFGFFVLILLLLASHAWVVLLIPRGWKMAGAFPQSFLLTITFLVVWWGTMFAATGWMFAKASAPPLRILPIRVYAAQEVPHLIRSSPIIAQ